MIKLSEIKSFQIWAFVLLMLTLSGKSSFFYQEYFVVQSIGLFFLCFYFFVIGFYNKVESLFLIFSAVVGVSLFFIFNANNLNFFQMKYFNFGLCLIAAWSVANFNRDEKDQLKKIVIVIAVVQALIAIGTQLFFRKFLFNSEAIGTVGNSDFLASILAAGIFFLEDFKISKKSKFLLFLVLGLGVLSTFSKGTIVLLMVVPLLRLWPRKTLFICLATFPAAGFLLSEFLKGRLQVWITAFFIMIENFWTGIGPGKFSSGYFQKNIVLMNNPFFKNQFGAWSSEVSDAHNLPLQMGSETGIWGLFLVLLLYLFCFRLFRKRMRASSDYIIFGTVKSLYTVLIPSIQNSFLLLFALADQVSENWPKKFDSVLASFCTIFLFFYLSLLWSFTHSQYYLQEGYKASQAGLLSSSLQHFHEASKYNPHDYEIILAKAYANLKLTNCDEAGRLVYEAVTRVQSMDSYKRGGHILYECRFFESALSLFGKLHLVFPEHRTTTMKIAWIMFFLKDKTSAKYYAEEVLKITPRRRSISDEKNLREANNLLDLIKTNKAASI